MSSLNRNNNIINTNLSTAHTETQIPAGNGVHSTTLFISTHIIQHKINIKTLKDVAARLCDSHSSLCFRLSWSFISWLQIHHEIQKQYQRGRLSLLINLSVLLAMAFLWASGSQAVRRGCTVDVAPLVCAVRSVCRSVVVVGVRWLLCTNISLHLLRRTQNTSTHFISDALVSWLSAQGGFSRWYPPFS